MFVFDSQSNSQVCWKIGCKLQVCLEVVALINNDDQWPRNRGVRGCNCNPRFQKLSHKNSIKHEKSNFWGYFATPATLDFGSLCGPWRRPCWNLRQSERFQPVESNLNSKMFQNSPNSPISLEANKIPARLYYHQVNFSFPSCSSNMPNNATADIGSSFDVLLTLVKIDEKS